jgi:parvulin-like peptidyl-prolyl isomerase
MLHASHSRAALLLLVPSLLLPACSRSGRGDGGAAVARVGDHDITVSEFQARLNEQAPYIRGRYATLEKKKEFLDNLVRFELMRQEAERRGLQKDPAVQALIDKLLVQELIRRQMSESEKAITVSDEEVKAYYKAHLDEFVRPERVRVSTILLATTKGSPQAAKVRADATKLAADLRKAPPTNVTVFAEAARTRSNDPATQAAGGDVGFKTREELVKQYGATFAEAAMGLKTVGDISGPLETDRGFYVLRMTGRMAGSEQPLEAAKDRIVSRLTVERRSKAMDQLVADLRAKTSVKIDDAVLEKIDATSTSGPVSSNAAAKK